MSERQSHSLYELINNRFVRLIGALTAFIAAVATIIITIQSFIGSAPQIEVRLMERELLTKSTNLRELRSIYVYNSDTVSSLWRCRIQLYNSGSKNIIGRGKHSDLIDSTIEINFDPHFSLVKIDPVIQKEIPVSIGFNRNSINFKFDQLLSNEKVEIIAYFINDNFSSEFHIPSNQKRTIENGKIIVLDYKENFGNSQPFVDRFAYPIPIIARVLGCILCFSSLLILIYLYTEIPFRDAAKYWKWHKTYGKEYEKYLSDNPSNHYSTYFGPGDFGKSKLPKPPYINSLYRTPLSALRMLILYVLAILSTLACILCIIKI